MTRYLFKIVIPISLLLLSACTSQAENEKPNIIFFFTDDQAYDTLGSYGNPDVKTHNIDKLGSQGVIFDRHYDTTAICMASRANVMTGLYEYKSGTNFMHGPMSNAIWNQSFPKLLKQAGYRTGFGGKFGFPVVSDPTKGGNENKWENIPDEDFDFWVGGLGQTSYDTAKNEYLARFAEKYPHSSRAYGAAGQEFIKDSVKDGQPFSLSIFFKAPHKPAQPDPFFDDVYRKTVFRKLPNYGREAGEHLAHQSRMGRQFGRFTVWNYDTDAGYQKELRLYNQQIYGVDYAIGMIVEELERQGISDNTVIIFTSDNGFFNGSHGMGSKVLPYEEGARVPLIIYDPRSKSAGKGRRVSAVTGNVDMAATILDLAGVVAPRNIDGKSLLPIIQNKVSSVREALPVFNVWGTQGTTCMTIVTETHKYIYWPYGDEFEPGEELFDLKNDPYELKNVISDKAQAKTLKAMRTEYRNQLTRWKDQAVPYNNYQQFGTILDPSVPWSDKKDLFPKGFSSGMRYYTEEIAN
ncbi:MAG: sulfatase [Verrucomicrobia bacterium]|nr:sulfatase [Verrucomicrobiota bacterium]MDA1068085.1 sulfatase [Verrucomicrobiota bacterium]